LIDACIPDGVAGTEVNATGDEQKKLDVLSNEMMMNSLFNSHVCAVLVSEENEEPVVVPEAMQGTDAALGHRIVKFLTYMIRRPLLCCI
jgi:fructose-1,6-bisphosphatase